jgi:hypothetical protein
MLANPEDRNECENCSSAQYPGHFIIHGPPREKLSNREELVC